MNALLAVLIYILKRKSMDYFDPYKDWNKTFDTFHKGGKTLRFHSDYMIDRQDVGQHSFQVALMAFEMASQYNALLEETNNTNDEKADEFKMSFFMLLHDLPEEYGGDIPGHIKKNFPKIAEGFEELETKWVETKLSKKAREVWNSLNDVEQAIFKFVDCYDCSVTSFKECQKGNHEDMSYISYACYICCKSVAKWAFDNNSSLSVILNTMLDQLFVRITSNRAVEEEFENKE